MSEPCRCQACVLAGVTTPSVTIPGYRNIPPQELHGVELVKHLEAQGRLRATIAEIRAKKSVVNDPPVNTSEVGT